MSLPEAGSVSDVRAAVIEVLHGTATILEVIGVGVIVAGAAVAAVSFVRSGGAQGWGATSQQFRANFGRAILQGLEFLVAADIIGTVAITPSFQSLGILGLIIAIRTLAELFARGGNRRPLALAPSRKRRSQPKPMTSGVQSAVSSPPCATC